VPDKASKFEEEGGGEPRKGGFSSWVARSPAVESTKGEAEMCAVLDGDMAETCHEGQLKK
jgi:hypothetical protein